MKWITARTMPIVFFMGGMLVSLVTIIAIFILRVTGVTNISVLAASSIFGVVIVITIVWYIVLGFMGKLKFSTDTESDYGSTSYNSIDADSDWD